MMNKTTYTSTASVTAHYAAVNECHKRAAAGEPAIPPKLAAWFNNPKSGITLPYVWEDYVAGRDLCRHHNIKKTTAAHYRSIIHSKCGIDITVPFSQLQAPIDLDVNEEAWLDLFVSAKALGLEISLAELPIPEPLQALISHKLLVQVSARKFAVTHAGVDIESVSFNADDAEAGTGAAYLMDQLVAPAPAPTK